MITPSYPVLATFCPQKKGVAIDAGTRSAAFHGFQPAGAAWVPDKAFDKKKANPKIPKKSGTTLFGIFSGIDMIGSME